MAGTTWARGMWHGGDRLSRPGPQPDRWQAEPPCASRRPRVMGIDRGEPPTKRRTDRRRRRRRRARAPRPLRAATRGHGATVHGSESSTRPHRTELGLRKPTKPGTWRDLASDPLSTNDDAFRHVHIKLKAAIERRGFRQLTAVQQRVAETASGTNLRISSETGSGKTVAIGLLLAEPLDTAVTDGVVSSARGPLAVIITPTRELAAQVREELTWLFADLAQIRVDVVTGGTDLVRERRRLARTPAVLVATPGRLLDHIRAGAVACDDIAHVVLDEADQMLDMGFRDELEAIVEALPQSRRSHLVSATFPRAVQRLADRFQGEAVHIAGTQLGAANQDIEHIAHLVRANDRYDALINCLLAAHGERCLVFVKRRDDASDVAERLAERGFSAMPLSGDLAQAQRTRTLNAFRNGTLRTLVATDVAARGIDVADIATVIHFDPPLEGSTYTHRSGRTGRAGRKGQSLIFVPPSMQFRVRRVLRNANIDASWEPVPTAAKLKKALVKRARRELHQALAAAEEPSEAQIAYATKLLSDYDPHRLVTELLALAEPKLACEPADITPVPESGRDRDAERPRGRGPGTYARFAINWGSRAGATPARLLAHVCRRGDVSGRSIGAVDIGDHDATFEVAHTCAEAFERAASQPDKRDPHIEIRRMDRDTASADVAERSRHARHPDAPRRDHGPRRERGGGHRGPSRGGGPARRGRGRGRPR
ncbi:MAG: DEAD/DEAH box helicase [Myxococcales bacterium FL481]|nr:MAG: DEAD/DEAH box helicase [Myxococcales bacterium FL481]